MTALTGARWSLVSRTACARAGAYGAFNTPEDEVSPEEAKRRKQIFDRGHDICNGRRLHDRIQLRREGYKTRKEAPIPWPAGTGHADLRAIGPRGKIVIEYTTTKGGDLSDAKVLQVAGYAIADNADAACVVSIDPHTYERHDYPVRVEAHRERVEALMSEVANAAEAGELPERTCASPFEGRYKMCPYAGTCFADWTQPSPARIDGCEADVTRLAEIDDEIRVLPRGVDVPDALETERAAIREKLAFFVEPGVEYVTAGVSVKRSVSRPVTRFALAKARKAGWTLDASAQDLAAFVSESTSERWFVRRIQAAA